LLPSLFPIRASETTFYLGSVERTFDDTGTLTSEKVYIPAGNATVVKTKDQRLTTNSQTNYLYADHLGSTVLVTDDQGVKETILQYYPYGNEYISNPQPVTRLPAQAGNSVTEKLYTGQRKDNSSDLYFYNARYYNPTTGNFISADKASGPNRYSYVSNNPVMRNDPSGLMQTSEGGRNGSTPCTNCHDISKSSKLNLTNFLIYSYKKYQSNIAPYLPYMPQNSITFKQKNPSSNHSNQIIINNNLQTKITIAKVKKAITENPHTKHALLNSSNYKEYRDEILPVIKSKTKNSSKYNETVLKTGKFDSTYFRADFSTRFNQNKVVCGDYAAMTDIQLKEFGINNSFILSAPEFRLSKQATTGEQYFMHAFNVVDMKIAVDSTIPIIMPINDYANWLDIT